MSLPFPIPILSSDLPAAKRFSPCQQGILAINFGNSSRFRSEITNQDAQLEEEFPLPPQKRSLDSKRQLLAECIENGDGRETAVDAEAPYLLETAWTALG
jgi:hypothetical protein